MARIRSVHPELFTDEAFCALTTHARLLYIGIWTLCDDHGIFEWKPFGMKINLLPVDSVDIPAHLAELERGNQIKRFEVDGKAYGAVRNFCYYQRPKKPTFKHPFPDWCRTYVALDRRKEVEEENQLPTNGENHSHRRGEEGREGERDNPEFKIESSERVAPAAIEAPPAAPSDSPAPILKSMKEAKPSLRSAMGTQLSETWVPDDPTCDQVKTEYGMTDEDIRSELLTFHALHAASGTFSANWQKAFFVFCKRWKDFKAKQAPARVELSKAPTRTKPFEPAEADWERACEFYAKTGRWSAQLGPDPLSGKCRCPISILTAHGINPETGERSIPPKKVAAS